jgi:hypothetical protein
VPVFLRKVRYRGRLGDYLRLFVVVLGEEFGFVVEVTKCISLITVGRYEPPNE